MSEANPAPAAGSDEPLSHDDGVNAIADILTDPPETVDLQEEDQAQDQGDKGEGDKPSDAEAADEETEAEQEDGPQGYDSGKFAADTAKVRLKDGTVISVQDLKRGFLSQQSFTRGTQENAKEREVLASRKAEVDQIAQTLKAQRDFLLNASQQFLPQPPDESMLDQSSPNFDPIRYMSAKADYEKRIDVLNRLHGMSQAEQARLTQEQEKQTQEARKREAELLLEAIPEFRKPEVYKKFWADAVETMAEYGFSEQEVDQATDHRVYKMMRDLAKYRKLRNESPAVKEKVESRPVLTGKKRMDPKEKTSREAQARGEQLRKTGDFDVGVRALMDLDL